MNRAIYLRNGVIYSGREQKSRLITPNRPALKEVPMNDFAAAIAQSAGCLGRPALRATRPRGTMVSNSLIRTGNFLYPTTFPVRCRKGPEVR